MATRHAIALPSFFYVIQSFFLSDECLKKTGRYFQPVLVKLTEKYAGHFSNRLQKEQGEISTLPLLPRLLKIKEP